MGSSIFAVRTYRLGTPDKCDAKRLHCDNLHYKCIMFGDVSIIVNRDIHHNCRKSFDLVVNIVSGIHPVSALVKRWIAYKREPCINARNMMTR